MPSRTDLPSGTTSRRTSRRCGARIRGGAYCKNPAGSNTDHPGIGPCARHGGNNPSTLRTTGVRLAHEGILNPDARPGEIVQLEPHNGLLWAIWISGGDVAYWSARLQELQRDLEVALDDDEDDPQENAKLIRSIQGEITAAYGQLRTANREMRSASKMALDAGLAERQVALAERMGGIIAGVIQEVTGQLGLTSRQEALLPQAVEKALERLEAPGAPTKIARPKAALINHKVSDVIDVDS